MKGTTRKTLSNSLSSLFSKPFSPSSITHHHHAKSPSSSISRVLQGFKQHPFSTTTNNPILEMLNSFETKLKGTETKTQVEAENLKENPQPQLGSSSFKDLGLNDELIVAIKEMNIQGPSQIQCKVIPDLLNRKSVVVATNGDAESSTFAYLLPIIQLLRRDEITLGSMKRKHPRAVVLCPSREIAHQISCVTGTIKHFVRGGYGSMLQDDDSVVQDDVSSHIPIGLAIGTPSDFLQKVDEGEIVYDDIKYLVLEDADVMYDSGYGPDISRFLGPLVDLVKKSGRLLQGVFVITSLSKIVSEEDASSVPQKIKQYIRERLPEFC